MKCDKELKYGVDHKVDPNEYARRQSRSCRKDNPVRYLLNQVKYRAKKTGMDYDLDFESLPVPTTCPIMGIPLFFMEGKRGDNSFSIDRIDNSKGYTKDNVRVISCRANIRKGDLTIEQVENLLAYMKGEI